MLSSAIRNTVLTAVAASLAHAQIEVPSGTKITCRLEQTLSSATADEGQPVQMTVTENVYVGNTVVIPQGAGVVGTIISAVPKRRMGRTGKLDFSIDKVRAVDGQYIPVRYTINKKEGGSHGVRTGVLTAGAAILFWPAAPVFLLMKGKDVTINRGLTVDVFTDQAHALRSVPTSLPGAQISEASPQGQVQMVNTVAGNALAGAPGGGFAPVTITSDPTGADVEVDGAFVGNTPSTKRLASGKHRITVRQGAQVWERTVQVDAGDTLNLHATLAAEAPARRAAAGLR